MTIETATYISSLNASYPAASDPKSEGDDHIRLLKSTVKATFPNVSGAVTPTHTELNFVDGVTSAIQTQLDAKASLTGTETLTNKTVNLTSNTLTGTTAQFNTALSDGDFATLAGTETLTNKTLTSPVLTNPSYSGTTANGGTVTTIDINGGTIDGTVIGGDSAAAITGTTITASTQFSGPHNGTVGATTPAAGTFTTLTSTGNATLGDAEASDTHAIKGATTLLANSASAALTVTQTGSGNAFVVEDSTSPDSTPFVVDAGGNTIIGGTAPISEQFSGTARLTVIADSVDGYYAIAAANYTADNNGPIHSFLKSRSTSLGHTIVQNGDTVADFRFQGSDGTGFIQAARITAQVDGTPGTNDMPGRLIFSTTADGASSPTEAMRIDASQNVGIGGTAGALFRLDVAKSTNGVVAMRIRNDSTGAVAQSIFQNSAGGRYVNQLVDYTAQYVQSIGSGITTSYTDFDTQIFRSNAGTERMRIDSAGNVGIGGTSATGVSLLVTKPVTGSTFSDQVYALGEIQSGVTSRSSSFVSSPTVANAVFTLNNWNHFSAYQGTKGASATVNNQYGFFADSSITGATNNFGFYSNIASAANRYNFYAAGTADNVFMGTVSTGNTKVTGASLSIRNNITGATGSYGALVFAEVQSDVTGGASIFQSLTSTQATAFTLGNLRHFYASQSTIGAGSTVTNQFGFHAENTITGATNNYGFYSNIAAAANRYNFYAGGTADNYFAGIVKTNAATAIPAGGTAGVGVTVSSTANFGVFFGSGAPTLSAAKGSLYLRSDGTTTNNRMYVNTDGSTTWTAVTTAA